ncbi:MAG TPA: hypothetical protein V6C86_24220 [Oculatellaceae cyanobacterium]
MKAIEENYFSDYLKESSKEVLWIDIEDVGDYQGEVFALGRFKDQFIVFAGYYGSCSGCGAWGEGGEPRDLTDVLASSAGFWNAEGAISHFFSLLPDEKKKDRDRRKQLGVECAELLEKEKNGHRSAPADLVAVDSCRTV